MRVLVDECLPKRLLAHLQGHDARTVPQAGWAGKTNGALLQLAEGGFDVFLTIDRHAVGPNDLVGRTIAVIVLTAVSNKLDSLLPLVPALLQALGSVRPGQLLRIGSTT